jgi:hypothetical protein
MDPDKLFESVRSAILSGDRAEILMAFRSLDLWLRSGGELPNAWKRPCVQCEEIKRIVSAW